MVQYDCIIVNWDIKPSVMQTNIIFSHDLHIGISEVNAIYNHCNSNHIVMWSLVLLGHLMCMYLYHMSRVKRICVFEHSVLTNFNCTCPAIQRGQGSGFLSEGSSWLTACMSEQRRFWRDCADAQARRNLRCSHRLQVPNSLDAVHMTSSLTCSKNNNPLAE